MIAGLRDRLRLRTRVRQLKTLYVSTPPPTAAQPNAVDPQRLARFAAFKPATPGHTDVFTRDAQLLFGPILDDGVHLNASLDWLLEAQRVTGTGGFSVGYSFANGWFPPYPETTGYIIPTLWDAFASTHNERVRSAAVRAADWECEIQLPSGAVMAGYDGPDADGFWAARGAESTRDVPAAFNTGQVMQGWNRTFLETGDRKYLDASRRAADYLAECIDEDGVFVRGLSPGPASRTRSYYARAAYGLAWTGTLTANEAYVAAATRNLDWVVRQQHENGWVAHANFGSRFNDDDPLTHTLAYVAEGLLESGVLLEQPRYVEASRRLATAVMMCCERRGLFLPATLTRRFTSADRFSCIPGNAQFAGLWLRHGLLAGDLPLVNAGLKMVDWLKGVQSLDNPNPGIRGGLPGSWPIDGGYSIFFYVDWAAKFFADALMLAERAKASLAYDG